MSSLDLSAPFGVLSHNGSKSTWFSCFSPSSLYQRLIFKILQFLTTGSTLGKYGRCLTANIQGGRRDISPVERAGVLKVSASPDFVLVTEGRGLVTIKLRQVVVMGASPRVSSLWSRGLVKGHRIRRTKAPEDQRSALQRPANQWMRLSFCSSNLLANKTTSLVQIPSNYVSPLRPSAARFLALVMYFL